MVNECRIEAETFLIMYFKSTLQNLVDISVTLQDYVTKKIASERNGRYWNAWKFEAVANTFVFNMSWGVERSARSHRRKKQRPCYKCGQMVEQPVELFRLHCYFLFRKYFKGWSKVSNLKGKKKVLEAGWLNPSPSLTDTHLKVLD